MFTIISLMMIITTFNHVYLCSFIFCTLFVEALHHYCTNLIDCVIDVLDCILLIVMFLLIYNLMVGLVHTSRAHQTLLYTS